MKEWKTFDEIVFKSDQSIRNISCITRLCVIFEAMRISNSFGKSRKQKQGRKQSLKQKQTWENIQLFNEKIGTQNFWVKAC